MKKTFSISEAISFGWSTFKSNWKFWVVVFFIVTAATGSSSFTGLRSVGGSGASKLPIPFESDSDTSTDINTRLNTYPDLNNQPILKGAEKVLGTSTVINYDNKNDSLPSAIEPKVAPKFEKWIWIFIPLILIVMMIVFSIGIVASLVSNVFRMGYINLTLDAARNKDIYYKTLLNQVSLKKAWRFLVAQILVTLLVVLGYILFIIPGIIFSLKYSLVSYVLVDMDTTPSESMKMSSKLTKNLRFKIFLFNIVCSLVTLLGILAFGVGAIVSSIVVALAKAYVYNKILEQSGMKVDQKSTETPLPPVTSGNLLAENLSIKDSLTVTN